MGVELLPLDSEYCKGITGLKGSVNLALSNAGLSCELSVEDVIEICVLGEAAIWDT